MDVDEGSGLNLEPYPGLICQHGHLLETFVICAINTKISLWFKINMKVRILIRKSFERKIVITFLPNSLNMHMGCSKEPSH